MSHERILLDDNGAELCITAQPEIEAPVLLRSAVSTHAVTFEVPIEDAPAVALAILEAAGIEGRAYTCDNSEEAAVYWLRTWKADQEDKAEREAEDAKVDAYRTALTVEGPIQPWEELPEGDKDLFRHDYRAAREFFTGEIVDAVASEPRVLKYGDPEPDRGTKWRDKQWDVWFHNGTGWTIGENSAGSLWPGKHTIGRNYFPMTEVL